MKQCKRCSKDKPLNSFPACKANKDGRYSYCTPCKDAYNSAWHARNRDRHLAANRKWGRALKAAAIDAYGDACACCGEAERGFLTIDHADGNGAEHRKREGLNSGSATYRWLKSHSYPPGFQVLCANCNLAKGWYGVCPHALVPASQ